jgi:phosphate transport system permease protein
LAAIEDQIPAWMPRWRLLKDRAATGVVTSGGIGVLVAILLIFFYLVYEILPLFGAATIERDGTFQVAGTLETPVYLAVEEQGEVALAIDPRSNAAFIDARTGAEVLSLELPRRDGMPPRFTVEESPEARRLALVYPDGHTILVKHEYRLTYPDDVRLITPRLEYPYGERSFALADDNRVLRLLALRDSDEALVVAGQDENNEVLVSRWNKAENFLTGEVQLEHESLRLQAPRMPLAAIHVGVEQRWVYLLGADGSYQVWDLRQADTAGDLGLADSGSLFDGAAGVSTSAMLLGGISLLVGSVDGELHQYFMVRDSGSARLQRIRSFDTGGAVIARLLPEHRRKGFLALDRGGELQVFHSTAARKLLYSDLGTGPIQAAAIAPRGDSLVLAASAGDMSHWHIENEHPDISWSALWSKVWYESYPEPEYVWQSSASNNDFEPKYSFSPLAFGTLKAAFYAMLVAAPLAICGAIYTAYFMAPALRRKIKPLIELMEALPTVILGFLAGLWLAPYVESNLTGVFSVLLLMPVGVLLFAFAWSRLPVSLRALVPDGWHAAILLPVVCLIGWACFGLNDRVELLLFGGDMRAWITNDLGISFDQRNALVVGIAMGLAVIPTIFSISEDAIFSVPRHLSYGSLALGATPWQTLVGVVMPTASPGIFSALMIGMGRAVGETMIVLMATGNTPIMDANIFEGMRTLAANIAVEVPEAEVDSTHYRVLFLAAFVLFLFTFVVNTMAEIIRQRLRIKYGSL